MAKRLLTITVSDEELTRQRLAQLRFPPPCLKIFKVGGEAWEVRHVRYRADGRVELWLTQDIL